MVQQQQQQPQQTTQRIVQQQNDNGNLPPVTVLQTQAGQSGQTVNATAGTTQQMILQPQLQPGTQVLYQNNSTCQQVVSISVSPFC